MLLVFVSPIPLGTKNKFSMKDFYIKCASFRSFFRIVFSRFLNLRGNLRLTKNPDYSSVQFPANLVIFTEEILNRKLHFWCSEPVCGFFFQCPLLYANMYQLQRDLRRN